jgi:hypothetical protein
MIFELTTKLNKKVILDKKRWNHILEHPEMKNQLRRIKETLVKPDEIRESLYDRFTWLYYKLYQKTPVAKKYMLVVVKFINEEGFLLQPFILTELKKVS